MKLIIFPGNFVPHIGGLETHVDEFSKHFSKYADITIFTPKIKGSKEKETRHKKVKVIRYPAFEIIPQYFVPNFFSYKFWKLLKSLGKPDWVMTRTSFFPNSTLGFFWSKLKGSKLIHVEHGSDFPQSRNPFIWLFSRLYMKTFGSLHTRFSDVLVGVSSGAKKHLLKNFWTKGKVFVIRRGFYHNKDVEPKKLPRNTIVFVGRLSEAKGVHDLIQATKNEKYNLLIIGEGGYVQKLKELSKESNCKITFTGKLEHEKVLSYLKGASLAVNPSYTEGLPTSVLDAVFSGCKVVATDVGGTKEILGSDWNKPGFKLIKPRKPTLLGKKIKETLKEKPTDVSKHKEKFDWKNHAKQYKEIMK